MNSIVIILFVLQSFHAMGNPRNHQDLFTRAAEINSTETITSTDNRTSSETNLMTCHANSTNKLIVDLEHCNKAATYMASNKSSCARYKTCTLMTRAGIGKAQAVQVTSPAELRYAFSIYFSEQCSVTHPIKRRVDKFPKTIDGELYLTAALCDRSDSKCNKVEEVNVCSSSTFEQLKDAPANLTEVPKIGSTQDSTY
ncbi:secreted protein [Melampsora americana]|nr:secreted protein [Melampsora americana]